MRTLYVSDLDGTLLAPGGTLSAYTYKALGALLEQGLQFTVATARTSATVGKLLSGLTLTAPAVLMNGAALYDIAARRSVKTFPLSGLQVEYVVDAMHRLGIYGFLYRVNEAGLTTYFEKLDTPQKVRFYEARRDRFNKFFQQADSFCHIGVEDVVYFSCMDQKEQLLPLYEELRQKPGLRVEFYKDVYEVDTWFIEAFSAEASKQHGVEYIKKTFGYDKVIGFGDNLNDLPMFLSCDEKYAVKNATQAVKDAADDVIGANSEDGVVKFLQEHVKS